MDLFNRTFMRFALGFIGIIIVSVSIIIITNIYATKNGGGNCPPVCTGK